MAKTRLGRSLVYPDMIRLSKRDGPCARRLTGPDDAILPRREVTPVTNRGARTMTWETPEFVEVKMDAEINSYQDDFGGDRDTGV